MNVKIDVLVTTAFALVDDDGNPVSGEAIPGNFTSELWNPAGSEVSGSITVTISELGGGAYRVTFTPDAVGHWLLRIFHSVYATGGQSEDFKCSLVDWDDIELIKHYQEGGWRVDAVTNEMIFFKADNSTEIARFDLFNKDGNPNSASVYQRDKQ